MKDELNSRILALVTAFKDLAVPAFANRTGKINTDAKLVKHILAVNINQTILTLAISC